MSANNQKENDLAIAAKLENYSDEKVAELVGKAIKQGYSGEELDILVDVLNNEFPDYAISVFDEDSDDQKTAESILLLESWCDEALATEAKNRM